MSHLAARPAGAVCALLALWLLSPPVAAVPAPPFPLELPNADGTFVTGILLGDEELHWAEAQDGYSLVYDPAAGAWVYAVMDSSGELIPSVYRPGESDPRAAGLVPHLRPSPEVRRAATAAKLRQLRTRRRLPGKEGMIPNLVLLVKFANHTPLYPPSAYEAVFNGEQGSFQAFYRETSGGRWHMTSTIVGWIPLPEDDAYYANRPSRMVRQALQQLDEQGFDFTRFDADGDGVIDAIDFIHSGSGYEESGNPNAIWSHFAYLGWGGDDVVTHDGITIPAYHTEPEYRQGGRYITQIGVICHETAHFFGALDLYDYGYDSAGIGLWGIMAAGSWSGPDNDGTSPSHHCAWTKILLGLVDPQTISLSTAGLALRPVGEAGEVLRLDAGMNGYQYFLLEHRRRQGFDSYLPGEGLLIYHVDEGMSDNDNQYRYLVDVEQADGLRELNLSPYESGDAGDPWPQPGNDAFTPTSTPSSLAYGADSSLLSVLNITDEGTAVTFDLEVAGSSGSQITSLPPTLVFRARPEKENPPPQTVMVQHLGASPLAFSATPQGDWIRLGAGAGTSPQPLAISVDTTGLPEGEHYGTVLLEAPAADPPVWELPVLLLLRPLPPALGLRPSALLTIEATFGGPSEASAVVQVVNLGDGALEWSAVASAPWLTLAPTSAPNPGELVATADVAGFAVGSYRALIEFSSPTTPTVGLPVELVVQPAPQLVASPTALVFDGQVGTSAPAAQVVTLHNGQPGSMDFTLRCNPEWLHCQPESGAAPAELQVAVEPTGLAAGEHTGEVWIESPLAGNGPLRVPVTLRLAEDNAAPGAPAPLAPEDDALVAETAPVLRVANALDPDGDSLALTFEVQRVDMPEPAWSLAPLAQDLSGQTEVEVSPALVTGAIYRWRARAADPAGLTGPWSPAWVFTVTEPEGGGCGCGTGGAPGAAGSWALGLLLLGLLTRPRRRRTGS